MLYPKDDLKKYVLDYFHHKNITIEDIAREFCEFEGKYSKDLTVSDGVKIINEKVFSDKDILQTIAVGIQLDKLAEQNMLDEPLLSIIKNDLPQFGTDELFGIYIASHFTTAGIANYGYLDQTKNGIAKKLDVSQDHGKNSTVNTFLDDIISSIVASASGFIIQNKD
ncbi:phosphatidylglycerophosphatase A [Apilactobacillus sp. TMW 2.2459]|uniref:Phosphatidylglycerophosphatase A n=1 Tax=Apilactobacillus xinyiensis TaxID=2841032 RepID=A0ABT0I084_9LACO|nr:phosphatidylglycerophosphatase A [Apilactobacillus xinyiensis]MCK8623936.1 phosphatidylglycerophosphatase A [Apilactobacillus xinyiensis]MCL0311529.1 phosphatidylglycerophosphatase A [Apilactobacillus xinyiensis]MCL0330092.1 phosphatidylglycerophosphatase A [Apilactobacillus xinyiensis]